MRTQVLIGAAMLAGGAVLGGGLALRAHARYRALVAMRLALIRAGAAAAAIKAESPLQRFGAVLARMPLLGFSDVSQLRQTLYAAGFVGQAALERFIGLKIALALLLTGFALVLPGALGFAPDALTKLLLVTGGLLGGMRLPDMIVASRASGRRKLMDRGLPDALDLMVVCGEAGVGLELSLERVATELRDVHPALAQELGVTVSEMRLLPDPLSALRNMGERMRLDSVRTIASTLSQTLKYGTPLGKALRTLTADFRLIRQTQIEERAARLPVLITVPMIGFILPATALVVAGPAFLQLIHVLGSL